MLDYARAVPGPVSCIMFIPCPSLSAGLHAEVQKTASAGKPLQSPTYRRPLTDKCQKEPKKRAAIPTCVSPLQFFPKSQTMHVLLTTVRTVMIVDHHFLVALCHVGCRPPHPLVHADSPQAPQTGGLEQGEQGLMTH